LKLAILERVALFVVGSLHTSNKTRIETNKRRKIMYNSKGVLYIHPIKQGLKPLENNSVIFPPKVLYIHPIKQGLKLNWHIIFPFL